MIICDTHCDVLWMMVAHPEETRTVTMENMKKGGISLQTCALFSGSGGWEKTPYRTGIKQLEAFRTLVNEEGWKQVLSPLEAQDGKIRVMLSMEGGEILEGSCERIEEFYDYGVRMIALTWNRENEIGYPAKSGSREGIKPRGWEMLHVMAEHKIAADTSHLNEAGFWDLIDRHEQPPMASHSCAAKLCPHFRNLTDEQIRAMIKRGGWIGVNFYPTFLSSDGKATAETICNHIDHICQLGGEKHVGLGSDFDGIETTPDDVRSPAEVPHIFDELSRRGYSDEAIRGIAGENFLDYYRRLGWK